MLLLFGSGEHLLTCQWCTWVGTKEVVFPKTKEVASPAGSASIYEDAVWVLSVEPPCGAGLRWQWAVRWDSTLEEEIFCVKKHGLIYFKLVLSQLCHNPPHSPPGNSGMGKLTWAVSKELRRLADEEIN